jgi:hypothetical protein
MNDKTVIVLASISLIGALALGTTTALAVPLEKQYIFHCSYFPARVPHAGQRSIYFTRADIEAVRALERML